MFKIWILKVKRYMKKIKTVNELEKELYLTLSENIESAYVNSKDDYTCKFDNIWSRYHKMSKESIEKVFEKIQNKYSEIFSEHNMYTYTDEMTWRIQIHFYVKFK